MRRRKIILHVYLASYCRSVLPWLRSLGLSLHLAGAVDEGLRVVVLVLRLLLSKRCDLVDILNLGRQGLIRRLIIVGAWRSSSLGQHWRWLSITGII